jgi:hypothetical protein
MTKLNNEICELNSDQLVRVSGGDNRVPWGAQKIAQENYARIRLRAEEQGLFDQIVQ